MKAAKWDVVAVGGGLAGIMAADSMASYGLNVLVIDENARLGGQYLRTRPGQTLKRFYMAPLKNMGFGRIRALDSKSVQVMQGAEVVGLTEQRELLIRKPNTGMFTIQPRAVLLATGARERFLPFKGWTLPGVISTGATQILIKTGAALPADNLVVGGMGVFPYLVASETLRCGGRVAAVLDQNRRAEKMFFAKSFIYAPGKALEGIACVARLIADGVPILPSMRIIEARGNECVEEVVAVKIDGRGRPLAGTKTIYPCKYLATGYGFTANTELASLAGCRLTHSSNLGGWIVDVSSNLETSVPLIFAAGEITGIGGAAKSATEGRLAALGILDHMGVISRKNYQKKSLGLKIAMRRCYVSV